MRRALLITLAVLVGGFVLALIVSLFQPDTNFEKMGEGIGALCMLVFFASLATGSKNKKPKDSR